MLRTGSRISCWGLGLVPCSVLLLSSVAQADYITNGSFEIDPFTANGNYELGLVGSDVTGWHIPSGDGVYPWGLQDGAFGAFTPFGEQWIVLGRWDTAAQFSIQQTMTGLTVGDTYVLSFAIASERGEGSEAEVSFLSGSSTATQTFFAPLSGDFWTNWATKTMNFVATSSSVTVQFKNTNPTSAHGLDLGLDNVSVESAVAAVPLPSSGLMSLGLFGGLGLVSRLRKRRQTRLA